MAENDADISKWDSYANLHDALAQIKLGLEHTIAICDLICDRRREGVEVSYFGGNPPESAIEVHFSELPAPYDHVDHELKTAVECLRDDWIPCVWDNLAPAINALGDIPDPLQGDLNEAAGGRWIIHTRRVLNDLSDSPSPYRSILAPARTEAGFPRNVSDAIHVCYHGPSRDRWREILQRVQERLAEIKACRPATSQSDSEPVVPKFLGQGRYDLGNRVITLTGNQSKVLDELVDMRSASLSDLRQVTGVGNPSAVLSAIRTSQTELAQHIYLPGGKGGGGYSTTIVDGRSRKQP